MGAYHTLDLELNRKFTLQKSQWDSVALERIGTFLLVFFQVVLQSNVGRTSVSFGPFLLYFKFQHFLINVAV